MVRLSERLHHRSLRVPPPIKKSDARTRFYGPSDHQTREAVSAHPGDDPWHGRKPGSAIFHRSRPRLVIACAPQSPLTEGEGDGWLQTKQGLSISPCKQDREECSAHQTYIADSRIFPYFLIGIRFHGNDMNTDIMTIKEVAAYLKLTEKTAYRLAAEGKIPGFKVGGSWRFRWVEIEKWIDKQVGTGE
jgi:excisionase family DNA binding protein